ncbi:MAG TPA: N-acetylmuramoyl-L-alanine amidase [Rickettsia endosymbiont of Omalisus fontisbellaquei]|nr:N-acetylmuramoyl-L-alanine amidase [Rickettsia endosymbiont of Omalisus fontisbellaquei]
MSKSKAIENNGISNTNSPNGKYMAPRPEGVKPSCVVITYSVSKDIKSAREALDERGASVHYIIDKDGTQKEYHNDLTDQAFYAGKSSWKGEVGVNKFGIGVMLINNAESDFPKEQIEQLCKFLEDIEARYPDLDLKHDLVGLGEVAERHVAPGKFFPWQELAKKGYGEYIETTEEQRNKVLVSQKDEGDKVVDLQKALKNHGYGVEVTAAGEFNQETTHFASMFNTRYDTGLPNEEPPVSWTEASQDVLSQLLGQEVLEQTENA